MEMQQPAPHIKLVIEIDPELYHHSRPMRIVVVIDERMKLWQHRGNHLVQG